MHLKANSTGIDSGSYASRKSDAACRVHCLDDPRLSVDDAVRVVEHDDAVVLPVGLDVEQLRNQVGRARMNIRQMQAPEGLRQPRAAMRASAHEAAGGTRTTTRLKANQKSSLSTRMN